ncbi:hypothetical protein [Pyxidicoccus trucidator]|uniref:hypothetical protein n=1 Tax=Pyxidicoccus trucidator TaxID=2709662 RepID=UPI0013DD5A02|nr:hypothetical protein [Pyxidicoccus trucidator]
MRLQAIAWFGLCVIASTGCLMAPREAEFTLEPGAERVEVRVELRDIRLVTDDLVEGPKLLVDFIDLESAKKVFDKSAMAGWGVVLTGVTWRAREQTLDVEVRGFLPRSAFDACASARCDDASAPAAGQCAAFPITKCNGEYSAHLPGSELEREYRFASPSRWPGDSRQLTGRLAMNPDHTLAKYPSALGVFTHLTRAPEAARVTLQRMERFGKVYTRDQVAEAAKLFEEARAAGDLLAVEHANRERMHLLYQFLASHRARLLSRPPGVLAGLRYIGWQSVPPEVPMPELLRLRLQIAYEAALRGFTESGALTRVDTELAEVCVEPAVQRVAASRQWCDLLMLRGPEGWVLETASTPRRKR